MKSLMKPNAKSEEAAFEIEGNAFGGLQKLLQGFCNPRKVDHETEEEADENFFLHAARNGTLKKTSMKVSLGVKANGRAIERNGEDQRVESSHISKETPVSRLDKPGELTELTPPYDGLKLRNKRSTEVVFFALLAVVLTICALRHLGFTMDIAVIARHNASTTKKLIDIGKKTNFDDKAAQSLENLHNLVAQIKMGHL